MPPELDLATAPTQVVSPATSTSLAPAPVAETANPLRPLDTFARRHLGSDAADMAKMLDLVGYSTLDALVDAAVPAAIRLRRPLALPTALSESEALAELRFIAVRNQVFRSYIGQGYHDTLTPGVIQRNILENPGWYTAYTPYQAEIAQGRLEALINFQTMVCDLTGMDIANASLLDEGTAAAEAMNTCYAAKGVAGKRQAFFVSALCHPQTLACVQTRARPLGIEIVVGDHAAAEFGEGKFFGALVQYPATDGTIFDYTDFARAGSARQPGPTSGYGSARGGSW